MILYYLWLLLKIKCIDYVGISNEQRTVGYVHNSVASIIRLSTVIFMVSRYYRFYSLFPKNTMDRGFTVITVTMSFIKFVKSILKTTIQEWFVIYKL